ncbi:MAG: hypothetical protein ABIF10_07065 [Candidatus Woesearchaeota archaeon]
MNLERKQSTETFEGTVTRNGTSLCVNIPRNIVKKYGLQGGENVKYSLQFRLLTFDKELKNLLQQVLESKQYRGYDIHDLLLTMLLERGASLHKKNFEEYLAGAKDLSPEQKAKALSLHSKGLSHKIGGD